VPGTPKSGVGVKARAQPETAERPERLDAGAVRRSMLATGKGFWGAGPLIGVDGSGALLSSMPGVPAIAAVERAARHPFAAQVGGMMGCAVPVLAGGVNQRERPRHGWGS